MEKNEDKVAIGKALAEKRALMTDYAGNADFQQWKAQRVLPSLSQLSFDEVVAKLDEFNLIPSGKEMSALFMPQRCLLADIGHYLRKYRQGKKPLSPFKRIQQLEAENLALKAHIQSLTSIQVTQGN